MSNLMLDDKNAMDDINPFTDPENFFPPGDGKWELQKNPVARLVLIQLVQDLQHLRWIGFRGQRAFDGIEAQRSSQRFFLCRPP